MTIIIMVAHVNRHRQQQRLKPASEWHGACAREKFIKCIVESHERHIWKNMPPRRNNEQQHTILLLSHWAQRLWSACRQCAPPKMLIDSRNAERQASIDNTFSHFVFAQREKSTKRNYKLLCGGNDHFQKNDAMQTAYNRLKFIWHILCHFAFHR